MTKEGSAKLSKNLYYNMTELSAGSLREHQRSAGRVIMAFDRFIVRGCPEIYFSGISVDSFLGTDLRTIVWAVLRFIFREYPEGAEGAEGAGDAAACGFFSCESLNGK